MMATNNFQTVAVTTQRELTLRKPLTPLPRQNFPRFAPYEAQDAANG
jgi:hypothetical protein